jgi:hypothetical protein
MPGRGRAWRNRAQAGSLTRPLAASTSAVLSLKLSVGSSIEVMVSKSVRLIRCVHFENPTDRLAGSQTRSPSLSKKTLDFEEISVPGNGDTECKHSSTCLLNLSRLSLKYSSTSRLNLSRFVT